MSEEKKQLTCMDLHSGDFILVESFGFPATFIDKVKTLSDTTVTTESGNKLSYYAISGIPLNSLRTKWLNQLDFAVGDLGTICSPAPVYYLDFDIDTHYIPELVYYKDNLAIDVVTSSVFVKGTLETNKDLKYLHEVQHWYYDVTGKRINLNIKDKNKS